MSKTRKECGEARAAALSPEKRKEIAIQGAKARWEPKLPKATHQGILRIMGKELPCVVLDNGLRLISQRSVFKIFGMKASGSRSEYPAFIAAKNLLPFINEEITSVIVPVQYTDNIGKEYSGYSAEIIPAACGVYLSARKNGALLPSQSVRADISEILITTLSRIGIIGLIDEATGYQIIRPRDALEAYLNKILSKELAAWCKKFPDIYYENIYKIRKWPQFSTSKNKFSCVGTYTNDLIYSRIGEDVLAELKERTPDTSKTKMHQWLTVDTGHPLLSKHLNEIITIQKVAIAQGFGWQRFMDLVDEILPKKINALELEPT